MNIVLSLFEHILVFYEFGFSPKRQIGDLLVFKDDYKQYRNMLTTAEINSVILVEILPAGTPCEHRPNARMFTTHFKCLVFSKDGSQTICLFSKDSFKN
jgi:hypothetical protein